MTDRAHEIIAEQMLLHAEEGLKAELDGFTNAAERSGGLKFYLHLINNAQGLPDKELLWLMKAWETFSKPREIKNPQTHADRGEAL